MLLITKYSGQGARITARMGDVRKSFPYDHAVNMMENHRRAAETTREAYAKRNGTSWPLYEWFGTPDDHTSWVWVCTDGRVGDTMTLEDLT
ncbi:hypothetical protein UFOVP786_25 [uncultured Caudovirales phage]|uniref:Uncharacterized protein n=1 Tax=uncultured Caudovirales phage TaxID=2100421 RepID=A0A6J5P3L8_9CAUD|nr:hypothetical protein UFOVP786_25 [uncultured Caudovirales phage]